MFAKLLRLLRAPTVGDFLEGERQRKAGASTEALFEDDLLGAVLEGGEAITVTAEPPETEAERIAEYLEAEIPRVRILSDRDGRCELADRLDGQEYPARSALKRCPLPHPECPVPPCTCTYLPLV